MNAYHDDVRTYGMRRVYKIAVTLLAGVLLALQAPVLAGAADGDPPPDSVPTTSLLIKMVSGLSDADQQAVIARNGGVESSEIAPLRLHVVDVDSSQLADVQQRYASDAQVQRVEVEKTREAQAVPSDTDYGQQWALPQIGWDQAYGTVVPSGSATIAVLDTGVDGNQTDLAGHLVPGFSAFPDSSPLVDPNGHGTAMATIAAAATDNATGIAGVAYAGVQVMPVQVLDANGLGQDGDIIAGVVAAADAGADVILMSFSSQSYSPDLQDAINYAWGTGAVLVAATGNDALATPSYPAGDAKVVGVSATDAADALWSGSNYGSDVFIGAPGVDILAGAVGGGTTSITGTSASAAIVAGAAALLSANDSSASNGVIVGRLARNADSAGTADQTGNGRVNLGRALSDIATDAVVPVGSAPSGAGGPFVGPYVTAATSVTSILVGAQSGTLTYGTAASATFPVTVAGSGNGTSTIGVTGLPSGATFTPSSKSCNPNNGGGTGCNFSLVITTSASTPRTPAGTFAFTVTMTGDSGSPRSDTGTLTIGTRSLTATATGVNKAYDGTTTATVSFSDNRLSGDAITVNSTSATFADNNIGTGKTVTVSGISIAGTDAGNYNLSNTTTTTTANITAKSVTGSFAASNKVYDGTTAATIATRGLSGVVGTDDVTLTGGTANFVNKNVGTGKTVNGTGFSLAGANAGNYTLASSSLSTTANITQRALVVSATGVNKVYDGATTATVTLSDDRVSGDVFTASYGSASFADKNVGTGKTVSVSGILITGTDAGNYSFNTTATTTANITAKAVTVTADAGQSKVYGNADPAFTYTVTAGGLTGTDTFSGSLTRAAGQNVGVYAIGQGTLSAGSNYTLTYVGANFSISPRPITVTAAANTKVYDATTSAAALPTITTGTLASGDTASFFETYDTKNVGTAKTLTPAGSVLDGNSGNNYDVTFVNNTTGVISARTITVTAATNSKGYDGTTSAAAVPTITSGALQGSDTGNFVETYATKNAGTGKTLIPSGSISDGNSGNNYALTFVNNTTGVITAQAITVSFTASDKVYDGTVSAGVASTSLSGIVGSDVVTLSGGSASFADKNVGTAKTVTFSGYSLSGADAGNYTFNTTASTTADITARALTVSATGVNKVYDGTTTATVTLSDDRASGDALTTTYTAASFNNKNVGTGKSVSVSGISISGADAGNYTFNTTASTTADITARILTVTASGVNRVYDGTTAASVTLGDDRISGDDVTPAYASAAFADKNVGTAKFVGVTGISISGVDAGNYTVNTTASTTANITARALTVSATGINKVYDGTTTATVTLSDDRVSGDVLTNSYTSAAFNNKNVGTGKSVSVTGISISGTDAGNYTANTTASTSADITARILTVTATGVNRVYDGTTAASVTLGNDRISGDDVTPAYASAAFADKNVGTAKFVGVTGISISGVDAGNYTFNTTASTTANITARALVVSAGGVNKTYDGDTTATVILSDDRVYGDVLSTSYAAASFADKNVGSNKLVSVTGISISGTDVGNYTFNTTASAYADITARALAVSAAGINKVYDGTATATVTLSDDRVSGDLFTDSYAAAAFANKNVGTAKPVGVTGISISGTDAGNYTFNTTASTTADITARILTVTTAGVNKVYDGTTTATVILSDDRVAGDVFTDGYTGALFADKNVGTAKPVNVSGISISGTDAGNYTFNTTASTTANITARALTVSATGINKVYDGTTAATVSLSDDRVTGDVFSGSYTGALFADKNVGTAKSVGVSGISISGTDAGNYTANTAASATADITARALAVSATGINKVYDGTATATVTLSNDRVSGDVLTTAYTAAAFNNKNVGTGKPVSVTGISISGTDAGNYTANTTASTTADITAGSVTLSFTASDKVYDGTTTAPVETTTLAGVAPDDAVTLSGGSASFADKNVGTAKTVTLSGYVLSGADAYNYTVNPTASTTADITARVLTVSATGVNKVYDGNATATVTLSDDRVSGDVFTDSYTGALFDSKNVGAGKLVSVTGISILGTDAGNYTFNSTASTSADVTARALVVSAGAVNKIYDGNSTATVTLLDDRVSGDVLSTSYSSAVFADKNVGSNKLVSVTGISISGTDAGNYTFNTTTSANADITARDLTVSATGVNNVYDGTTTATVTLSDDRVSGDALTTSYTTATFNNKNVGTGKPVSVTGISIAGTDAGNYTFNTTASTTADITARALTASATGVNKVYEGNTTATVILSDDRIAGDVFTDSYTGALFADKNVGTGKSVSVSGISISGADAGNYTFNSTASTTADITARVLTVSAAGVNKVYDGNATATVNLSDDRVAGDVFTTSYAAAAFDSKNVGTGKPVGVSGISISGTDAGNYTFNSTASTTANITARALVVSATGVNKVYDGTATATVTLSDDRVAGDVFTDSYASALFADKNVGTAKSVSVSGISISGTDAGNYTANTTTSTTADITARALTVSATGVNKVYDSNTTATVTLSDNRVAGDVFTDSYVAAAFADKNVGTGKSVSVSGISISGADAGNYTFNTTASTTANITARALTVSATGINKVYNGNTTATVSLSDDRVAGDVFTDSYGSAAFNDKNVGTGKPVNATGISISGTDAGNYSFNSTVSTTANITARALTVSAAGVNKVYDGNTTANVTLSDNRVAGDVFADSYGAAAFADKNVGTAKSVGVTGISISGTDVGNYTFNTTSSTSADITPAALNITADDKTMISGGSAPAFTVTPSGFVSGETMSNLAGTPVFVVRDSLNTTTVAVNSTTPAGMYLIIPSGLTSSNYNITFVNGNLKVSQRIEGFYSPVDMTVSATVLWNSVKGGSTVPLKFRVYSGANQVTSTTGITLHQTTVNCAGGIIVPDDIPTATGGTVLRYDTSGQQFIFNWSVPSKPNVCYLMSVQASDGSVLTNAYFRTK